jgi:hypothetical protein
MEATGLVSSKTAITIEKALEDFLTDVEKNRKVKPSTMRKYNLLSRTIREFCQNPRVHLFEPVGRRADHSIQKYMDLRRTLSRKVVGTLEVFLPILREYGMAGGFANEIV